MIVTGARSRLSPGLRGQFLVGLGLFVLFSGAEPRTVERSVVLGRADPRQATVPMTLDHNRMLVDGAFQRADASWRRARPRCGARLSRGGVE